MTKYDDLVKRLGERTVTWHMPTLLESEAKRAIEALTAERDALAAEVERLGAKLAKAEMEKLDAIATLDAWFDRRKLGHEAVDQAVIDVASGYLRTSRVGGMGNEESDLILGVIQDMARLGLFADLFARTTLAELKGEK